MTVHEAAAPAHDFCAGKTGDLREDVVTEHDSPIKSANEDALREPPQGIE
jgi:hypothetical protein